MGKIKDTTRFAGIEWLLQDYFRFHVSPVMEDVRKELGHKQAEEMRDYSCSAAGILSFMASSQMPGSDPYQLLKVTGEWNSKTTEDYVEMCWQRILASGKLQQDLALLAGEWRNAVIKEIGRAKYDECSARIGCDLACAYVGYRVEKQMIDKLVRDGMPKSSADYILRKAAKTSLFGIAQTLNRSPLDAEIEARGEAAYKPSAVEKGAGWALGTAADALAMGGAGSWTSFLRLVGFDVGMTAVANLNKGKEAAPTADDMETCISKGVFGSETNVFNEIREEEKTIQPHEDAYITGTNEKLANKLPIVDFDFGFMGWNKQDNNAFPLKTFTVPDGNKRDEKYKDVPLIVAPGQEEAYLKEQAELEAERTRREAAEAEQKEEQGKEAENSTGQEEAQQSNDAPEQSESQATPTNENGWGGLLANFGLDGMGDIGQNLGYVLAMLPDLLVGIFTGKTQSLGLKDNLVPIAAVIAGLFVKNPILKMLLIGVGGLNLLNKAGHEALERGRQEEITGQVRYKAYPDEPLDPRIGQPVLQGNTLVATIDKVPCTIQLTDTVADAYHAGALPLNTLANAVLARYDRMRCMAEQNYEQSESTAIHRTRGIQ